MATFPTRITGTSTDRPPRTAGRPVSGWAFVGVAVSSFGGPLALAALYAPGIVAMASASAGLAMAAAVAGLSARWRHGRCAGASLIAEFAGAVVLAAGAAIVLAGSSRADTPRAIL